jgi:hypothetical protein
MTNVKNPQKRESFSINTSHFIVERKKEANLVSDVIVTNPIASEILNKTFEFIQAGEAVLEFAFECLEGIF